jgi:hypothetical protein
MLTVLLVSLVGTIVVVGLFSLGVANLSHALHAAPGSTAQLTRRIIAYACFAVSGAAVLGGLYLYAT